MPPVLIRVKEEREKEGTGWIRLKGGEGLATGEEKKEDTPGGKETEEKGKWSSPKDLCVILENCRDLFVKQNFPLI
jgi:hypothetical protein